MSCPTRIAVAELSVRQTSNITAPAKTESMSRFAFVWNARRCPPSDHTAVVYLVGGDPELPFSHVSVSKCRRGKLTARAANASGLSSDVFSVHR